MFLNGRESRDELGRLDHLHGCSRLHVGLKMMELDGECEDGEQVVIGYGSQWVPERGFDGWPSRSTEFRSWDEPQVSCSWPNAVQQVSIAERNAVRIRRQQEERRLREYCHGKALREDAIRTKRQLRLTGDLKIWKRPWRGLKNEVL